MILIPRRLLGVIALASIATTLACGSDTTAPAAPDRTALLQAESQWNAAAVHDYNYDLVSDQHGQHDSVQVQVRNDQLTVSKSYIDGQSTPLGATIPAFFSAVDDALTAGLTVSVAYDPQLGYPRQGGINAATPGGGASWRIVNFTRLP